MSHDQGESLAGVFTGSAVALLANLANWLDAGTLFGELFHAALLGFVGGALGYMGKKAIHRFTQRTKTK